MEQWSTIKLSAEELLIDAEGYRANIGIIIVNDQQQLLWCRRVGTPDAWQFPQGGLHQNETAEQALFRELHEELGLSKHHVEILGQTKDWLKYVLPKKYRRYDQKPLCIGQKQKWFLLKMLGDIQDIQFDQNLKPEFDQCRWVSYWYPVNHVILFKRQVYKAALTELQPLLENI